MDREEGVGGESWEIHGGGFYRIHKFRVAPPRLPKPLHWYKWEAYWTWLSGFALLCIVYYSDARLRLIDPTVAELEPWQAILISIALLAAAWLVYDLVCRLLADRPWPFVIVLVALVTATAYGVGELYAPRAAYLQVGAMLGTIMGANVLFVIIPGHWELVRAKEAGREPDPLPGIRAKQRSVHNNYLTLPVLFTMLAGHFPFTYTHDHAWAVLVALMAVGAAIRHYFNRRHAGETLWWIPVGCACAIAGDRGLAPPARHEAGCGRGHRLVRPGTADRADALCPVPLDAPDRDRLRLPARRRRARHDRPDPRGGLPHQGGRSRLDLHAVQQRDAHDRRGARSTRTVDRRRCEDHSVIRISVAGYELTARLEEGLSPRTVAFFRTMLPYESKLIQARWSGQAAWIPMGDFEVGDLGPEDPTSYPAPGELLLYPGGVSEVEILFPYGDTCFASKAGQLAGNHFATVVDGLEHLPAIGELVLWHGAQDIVFSEPQ